MSVFRASGVVAIKGRAAAGVTVSFAVAKQRSPGRPAPPAVRTDKLGRWAQDGFLSGVEYVAVATAPGVTFRPARLPLDEQHTDLRSTGTVSTFAASGVARKPPPLVPSGRKPPGIPGVLISFVRTSGRADLPAPPSVTTGADGTWQREGFQAGATFRAVPSKAGLAFSPASVEINPLASSEFTGTSNVFSVQGRILTAGAAPEPGVAIRFEQVDGTGATPAATTTDGSGRFSQSGFARASRYRVRPQKAGLSFTPASRTVELTTGAVPTVFASFERRTTLVVTGQVLTTAGAGLLSTVIRFDRLEGTGAVPLPVTTTSNGEYRAAGLDAGTTYLVTAHREGFGFAPARLRAASPGTTTLNLTAFPAFEVAGRVLETSTPLPFDAAGLFAVLGDLPGLPDAVVAFHRRDRGPEAPPPVVTAADGSFMQRGFEVGGEYTVEASAPGFVGGTVAGPLGLIGIFGGPPLDAAVVDVTHDRAERVDGVVLVLMRPT